MAKPEFLIQDVTPGKLNALVKNIMAQTGTEDPNEAVRLVNSGEWKVVRTIEKKLLLTTATGIEVYDHGDHFRFTLPSTTGKTGAEWIAHFEKKGDRIGSYAKSVLLSNDFKPTSGVTTEVAVLKGSTFKDNERVTKNIRKVAGERALETPNAEIACLIRDNFTDTEIEAMGLIWIVAMHEPIKDSGGGPGLLDADRSDDGRWLRAYYGEPDRRWNREYGFAFAVSQVSA